MARVCFDTSVCDNPHYDGLKPRLCKLLFKIICRMEEAEIAGEPAYSDLEWRQHLHIGPKPWEEYVEKLLYFRWFARDQDGCLIRARHFTPEQSDSAAAPQRSPDAERKHEERLAERVASLVMARLGLATEQEGGQSSSKVRTNGAQKADKSPSELGQMISKHRTKEGTNSLEVSEFSHELSEVERDSRAGAELNSNLIKLNSISSSEENLNSNSIQLNLIGEGQTQNPESPAPDPKTRIRSALLFYGLKPEETDKAFEVKSLEEIAQGLECLDLGYWKAATKKQYSDVVTLRNYLFSGLDLHSKFKAVLKERQTGSLALLFRVEGGKARERPTCSLALPEKLTPEQEEALAAQAKRDVANIRANLGLRHATV